MDFFPLPYQLNIFDDNIIQKYSFIRPNNLFSDFGLENIIQRSIFNNVENDRINISGIAGEYLAQKIYEINLNSTLNKLNNYEGKFIDGKIGYLINSSDKYLAKLIGENRVVILKKEKSYDNENKFGFRNIAEIDGLYQIKKNQSNKNIKKYIAMEVKTGSTKIKASHIIKDIIFPLRRMYRVPVSYTLIGFKSEIYFDVKKNILNNYLTKLAEELFIENIEFTFMHFPFEKEEFFNFVEKIESKISNTIKGTAVYYKTKNIIEIESPDGLIKGKFIPF